MFTFFTAIKATSDALKDEGFDCATYVVDISDKEQVYEIAKKVKREVGKVDVLINNAGVVTCRTLMDLPDKAIETTYGVNILSHYWVRRFNGVKIQDSQVLFLCRQQKLSYLT